MKKILFAIAMLVAFLAAVVWNGAVRGSILDAGERCVTVLIPSLYLYALLAAMLIRSGVIARLSRPLGKWGMLLVVLFSQIGGYPVGAQMLHEMRRSEAISAVQERKWLCVCMGCGPGFLFGTVCQGVTPGLCAWMLLSCSLPPIMLALLLLDDVKLPEVEFPRFSAILTQSAESAANAMLKVTAMVLAFAGGMGILEGMGFFTMMPPQWEGLTRSLLEVSCVTRVRSLPLAAAVLSFGGICVHLQIAAICEGNVDWVKFWLCRGSSAVLAFGICKLGTDVIFRDAVPAALQAPRPALTTGSPLPGLCLLIMSVMLLHKTKTRSA